jgi:hypothetical protein
MATSNAAVPVTGRGCGLASGQAGPEEPVEGDCGF